MNSLQFSLQEFFYFLIVYNFFTSFSLQFSYI